MNGDPFAPLNGGTAPRRNTASWMPVLPVPPDAPAPPASHFKLGKPTTRWRYTDTAGRALGFVDRYDPPDGQKVFRPLIYARPAAGGAAKWRWESWPAPRPLYGLQKLAERPDAPVVVCEGEKSADAASGLLPKMVTIASPNGSEAAAKADWSPLCGRSVIVWPDADTPGLEYAKAVAKLVAAAGALSVAIVSPPSGCKVSWDAADALAEGWDEARADEFIANAAPAPNGGGASTSGNGIGRHRGPPQRDVLIGLTDDCEFWHDPSRLGYVTFPVNHHREHWGVRSREFKMWLSGRFYEVTGGAIGGQALEDGIRILESRAVHGGAEYEPFIRVGQLDDKVYLDLCDRSWRVVEITRDGRRIIGDAPLKLLRSPSMRPLPEPEDDGMIEELRSFVNLPDDQFMLAVACLVATLRPRGPYPILCVNGEQGAGKSIFCRMFRGLVDPSAAPIRSVPKDDHNLTISAFNSHVLAFDNLSSVPAWLADALCRLSTGGGFATRTLHTDREETIFEGQRPILLNGIPLLTERADLADRALTVHLRAIPEAERRPEEELWGDFEQARPRILGALLDAVSAAIRHLPTVVLDRPGRMADFEKWLTAAEPGLGWERGAFRAAYHANRRDISESSFEADPVAVAIRDFVIALHPEGWNGTPTELLAALNERASESVRRSKIWPATAQGLGNRFDRIKPLLRAKGFSVDRRHSGQRVIIIVPLRNEA
jgi:putative DNA primase/helicase